MPEPTPAPRLLPRQPLPASDAPSDAALVGRVRAGEPEAFRALASRHMPRLWRLCAGMVDGASADELAQEALVRAWRRLDALQQPAAFGGWLLGIGRHLCLDALRRRPAPEPLREGLASAGGGPSDQALAGEQRERVRRAVQQLDERYRAAIELRYFAEASYDEIGSALGISFAGVNQRLTRARQRLRTLLGGAMEDQ